MMLALERDTIERRAPAVYGYPADHMSQKYGMVRSEEVIDTLQKIGYRVTDAVQDRPSRRDPMTVRHMLQFTPEYAFDTTKSLEEIPRITFVNSHNGRTKARFYSGFLRFVCLNGLIVGDIDSVAELFHSQDVMEMVQESITKITRRLDERMEAIENWKVVQMSDYQRNRFAAQAREIRFKERAEAYTDAEVLQFRRDEDRHTDLWHTYNVAQENLMSRSLEGRSAAGKVIHSRPITNIQANVEMNAALWSLASETAVALAA